MSTHTLYLDCLILASAAYPSGFSHSMFTLRRGGLREVSTPFLGVLVLPYLAVALAVWTVRPGMLVLHGTTLTRLAVAILLAPVALLTEYGLHALVSYWVHGTLPRGITVPRFWHRRLSLLDILLIGLVVIGEEILYREIWLGTLYRSFGFPALLALGISAMVYALNHLAFGATSVLAKTVTGHLYGGLYLLGEQSVWLPIITHGLQNIVLFTLTKERHA